MVFSTRIISFGFILFVFLYFDHRLRTPEGCRIKESSILFNFQKGDGFLSKIFNKFGERKCGHEHAVIPSQSSIPTSIPYSSSYTDELTSNYYRPHFPFAPTQPYVPQQYTTSPFPAQTYAVGSSPTAYSSTDRLSQRWPSDHNYGLHSPTQARNPAEYAEQAHQHRPLAVADVGRADHVAPPTYATSIVINNEPRQMTAWPPSPRGRNDNAYAGRPLETTVHRDATATPYRSPAPVQSSGYHSDAPHAPTYVVSTQPASVTGPTPARGRTHYGYAGQTIPAADESKYHDCGACSTATRNPIQRPSLSPASNDDEIVYSAPSDTRHAGGTSSAGRLSPSMYASRESMFVKPISETRHWPSRTPETTYAAASLESGPSFTRSDLPDTAYPDESFPRTHFPAGQHVERAGRPPLPTNGDRVFVTDGRPSSSLAHQISYDSSFTAAAEFDAETESKSYRSGRTVISTPK